MNGIRTVEYPGECAPKFAFPGYAKHWWKETLVENCRLTIAEQKPKSGNLRSVQLVTAAASSPKTADRWLRAAQKIIPKKDRKNPLRLKLAGDSALTQ